MLVVSPPPAGRVLLGDTPLAADGRAAFLFQAPGEDHLRGVLWGEMHSGILGGRIPMQTAVLVSPDGSRYLQYGEPAPAAVFDRDGRPLGDLPWTTRFSPAWARDGRSLCAVRPETSENVSALRLETAAPGQAARLVASGFATVGNNTGAQVLACDPASDRVVVTSFGQGPSAGRFWVIRLSTGAVLHTEDLAAGNASSRIAASADGVYLAQVRTDMLGVGTTIIRTTDSQTALQTISDFGAIGFSDDGRFLVGWTGGGSATTTAYFEWQPARLVWSVTGRFAGHFPQPNGAHMAIGVTLPDGACCNSEPVTFIVGPNGTSLAVPPGSRAQLRH